MVYVIQSVGELCLSPIGLSMVTKLAPVRLVGFGMGGWFLSTGIGNNLSGIFAGDVSGETGMTTASALGGYTFGFWALLGARRAAVPDRAADPEADARREVEAGIARSRDRRIRKAFASRIRSLDPSPATAIGRARRPRPPSACASFSAASQQLVEDACQRIGVR